MVANETPLFHIFNDLEASLLQISLCMNFLVIDELVVTTLILQKNLKPISLMSRHSFEENHIKGLMRRPIVKD